ncbi:hypothetical protein Unana1_03875 [Umbelopsis nana]
MFGGGSAFGSNAFGQQQPQQQQQNSLFGQQPQQQQSTFGGFGATSAAPSAFGATNTGMSAFGATPAATNSAFGAQTAPAFGSTSNTTSAFNARPSAFGSSAFGSTTATTTPAFGASTTPATGGGLFGARPATTSAFGSTAPATGGVFGSTPAANTGFGASTSTPFGGAATGQVQGTVNPEFTPTSERDTSTGVNNSYQSITAMPAYRNYSVEELRVQDYQAGRKNAGAAAAPGGAFGATTSGFGAQSSTPFGQTATTNTFGMPSTSTATPAFGQSTGGFGQTTSAFGQSATGGFGSTNTGATGGGLFGQQPTSTASSFGSTQPAATGFGGTAFGQQPQQQSTGFGNTAAGGFGASTAAKPFSFGSTPATSQPATGFGGTGTSLFGQQPQQQPQQSVGGLFGQAAQSTPSFGQQATGTTSFGFGQKPATQPTTGFGGFGATTANKPATTFNFGTSTTTAPSTAATTGFGGFGASTGATGFGSTGTATSGLFGASKPAATTGLFGNTQQGATTGFGGFGNTTSTGLGSGLFGQKPATGTTAAPSLFGTQQQATGGFGFGGQQTANANTFSLPATGGLTTFGTTGLQQQPNANQPPLYASLDKYPYGYNPLFENLPAGTSNADRSSSVAVSEESNKKLSSTPHFTITPRAASMIKLRGYSFTPTGDIVSRKTGGLDGISDDAVLRPEAFAPRPSIKRLIINKKVSPTEVSNATNGDSGVLNTGKKSKALFDPHLEMIAVQHGVPGANQDSESEGSSISEPAKRANRNTAFSDNAMAQGYYIKPSLQTLGNMSREELKKVQNLVVGLKGVGEITFDGPVDLSDIDLDQIMVGIVHFQPKTCTVYPDEDAKPPQGKGLNVPATIKLEKCYPIDKTTKQPITDPQHPRVIAIIRKLRAVPDTEFIDFDASSGTWTFKVQHF